MNTITGLSFYDSLNKLTVGTLLFLLVGGSMDGKAEMTILFFVIAFVIGIFYQAIIQTITRCLNNNMCMIRKAAHSIMSMASTTQMSVNKKVSQTCNRDSITKEDYLKAYYNVARNGLLMNIPILEALENFLRNLEAICLLYFVAVVADCGCSCINGIVGLYGKCVVALFLVLLLIFIPFVWYSIQMKIFELVWEGDFFVKQLNEKL